MAFSGLVRVSLSGPTDVNSQACLVWNNIASAGQCRSVIKWYMPPPTPPPKKKEKKKTENPHQKIALPKKSPNI